MTPKQERFCQEIVAGKSQADAYRAAFDAKAMKDATIQQAASRLMADCKVAARVAELRKPVTNAAQVSLAEHLARLSGLSEAAEKEGKYSAAVAAEIARGKAAGLYVERTELTGKDGAPIPVTSVPLTLYLEARQKVLDEF
jgi:phage terminase small subunit